MRTLRDAQRELGVDNRTLWRLLAEANITPHADPMDRRKKLLTDEQIAILHKGKYGIIEDSGMPEWAANLLKRVERIEQRLGVTETD